MADQTLEREKTLVFQLENFFLCLTDSRTHLKKIMRCSILQNFESKY
jgi:hypothetical protein